MPPRRSLAAAAFITLAASPAIAQNPVPAAVRSPASVDCAVRPGVRIAPDEAGRKLAACGARLSPADRATLEAARRGSLAIGPKQDDPVKGRSAVAIGPKQDDPSSRGLAIGPKQDDPVKGRGAVAIGPKQDDPRAPGRSGLATREAGSGLATGRRQHQPGVGPQAGSTVVRPGGENDPKAIGPKQDDPLAIGPKQDDPRAPATREAGSGIATGRRQYQPIIRAGGRPGDENDPKAGAKGIIVQGGRSPSSAALDGQVTSAVARRLGAAGSGVRASAAGGVVTLSGQVRSPADRTAAEQAARSVAGVSSIQNNVTIAP